MRLRCIKDIIAPQGRQMSLKKKMETLLMIKATKFMESSQYGTPTYELDIDLFRPMPFP
jgi:hypothetical protein